MSAAKARWADKAERCLSWATSAEAKADALVANHNRDWAFISQPGHLPGRAREMRQTDRAMELRQKAEAYRDKASNLQRLATTQKGDAESARQVERDAKSGYAPGDIVLTILYGPREIVRVNRKTFTVRDSFGGTMTVDKAHCK